MLLRFRLHFNIKQSGKINLMCLRTEGVVCCTEIQWSCVQMKLTWRNLADHSSMFGIWHYRLDWSSVDKQKIKQFNATLYKYLWCFFSNSTVHFQIDIFNLRLKIFFFRDAIGSLRAADASSHHLVCDVTLALNHFRLIQLNQIKLSNILILDLKPHQTSLGFRFCKFPQIITCIDTDSNTDLEVWKRR